MSGAEATEGPAHPQPLSILVPTDFSETADSALKIAIHVASILRRSIDLVHVHETPEALGPNAPGWRDLERQAVEQIGKNLAERKGCVERVGIRCDEQRLEGAPWHAIVEFARMNSTSLIIMGTHGRSGLRHLLLGSVTERVIRHAPCPVLVVPPERQEKA